jgi:hypothetical protein
VQIDAIVECLGLMRAEAAIMPNATLPFRTAKSAS